MKKWATVFVVLLFASTASAQVITNPTTNARMGGLGVANWQIEDDFNIWINPAQVSNYKNVIYGELGTDPCVPAGGPCGNGAVGSGHNGRTGGAYGGLNVDTRTGTWGLYLGRPYAGPLATMATAGAGTAPTANRFDLFYGLNGMPFGFYLSYANVSAEVDTPPKTTNESTEINVGAGGMFMGGNLEGAINVGLPSGENNLSGTNVEGDAGPNFAILVRHHGNAAMGRLLTTAQVASVDASTKIPGTDTDNTTLTWRLDTALNSNPNDATLFVAGIGIVMSSNEVKAGAAKTETDTFAIPVNLAVEHQTFKKVQSRFGVAKAIYSSTSCKDAATVACAPLSGTIDFDNIADGAALVSGGLGWMVTDNLSLDAVINLDVLFTGTYLVSGVPETLASNLSATWRFQ